MTDQLTHKEKQADKTIGYVVEETFDRHLSMDRIDRTFLSYMQSIDTTIVDNDFLNSIGLSAKNVYCSLTGQRVGERDDAQISIMMQVYGVSRIAELTQYISGNDRAWHWYDTSGEALKKLAEHDPYGYFVYAASIALRYRAKGYNGVKAKKQWETRQDELTWIRQKIALWHLLQSVPVELVIEANIGWQTFLAEFDPSRFAQVVPFHYRSLLELGTLEEVEQLGLTLRHCARAAYRSDATIRAMIVRSSRMKRAIPGLREKFGGHTNFMQQGMIKGESEFDYLVRRMEATFPTEEKAARTTSDFIQADQHARKAVAAKVSAFTSNTNVLAALFTPKKEG